MEELNGFTVKDFEPEKKPRFLKIKRLYRRLIETFRAHKKLPVFLLGAAIIIAVLVRFGVAYNRITVENGTSWSPFTGLFVSGEAPTPKPTPDPYVAEYVLPEKEKTRLDILILGIRGEEDDVNGGLLADTIILFSHDSVTDRSSLISIPRDLYLWIPALEKHEKINSIYLVGYNDFDFIKNMMSRITGVYIDHMAVVDFTAFTEIIDTLDGVDIYLEQPFEEPEQWTYPFKLASGSQHLDSEQALYYVRSRYSTSDFDRSRRQQQVLFAIRKKVLSLGILANPFKVNEIINSVEEHVKTDIGLTDVVNVLDALRGVTESKDVRRYVIHSENVLYEKILDDEYHQYVLLPRNNTLKEIHELFQTILE